MNEIKSLRQRPKFLGITLPNKVSYMKGDRFQDQMHYKTTRKYELLRDVKITLEKIFENEAPLAINHWVGVFRITYVNDWEGFGVRAGDFDQFVVDTAAGRDTVVENIQQAVLDELEYFDIDLDCNWVDLDIPDSKVKTKSYKVD